MAAYGERKDNSVQSLNRALDMLEALGTHKDGLGITALARATGLSKSTAHRLAATLVERGFVEQTLQGGGYRLGLKYIEIASYYINTLELQTEARPYLREITADLGLTAHLGILDGHEVVYVEKLDILPGIRLYSQIGLRVPSYCSSLGKCLLSGLSGEELQILMGGCAFERYTERTLPGLEALRQELRKVRAQVWAIDDEEYEPGHRCVGAPIFDYRGDVVAAVSASGPVTLLDDALLPRVVEKVKAAARKISQRLGYVR